MNPTRSLQTVLIAGATAAGVACLVLIIGRPSAGQPSELKPSVGNLAVDELRARRVVVVDDASQVRLILSGHKYAVGVAVYGSNGSPAAILGFDDPDFSSLNFYTAAGEPMVSLGVKPAAGGFLHVKDFQQQAMGYTPIGPVPIRP